jgi:hypothetical protein
LFDSTRLGGGDGVLERLPLCSPRDRSTLSIRRGRSKPIHRPLHPADIVSNILLLCLISPLCRGPSGLVLAWSQDEVVPRLRVTEERQLQEAPGEGPNSGFHQESVQFRGGSLRSFLVSYFLRISLWDLALAMIRGLFDS